MQKIKSLITSLLFCLITLFVFPQSRKDSLSKLVNKLGQQLLKEKQAVGLSIFQTF